MPKIEIQAQLLHRFLGRKVSLGQLEELLTVAKAQLDEQPTDDGQLKIELNDTNRPDLWSTAGLARQLKAYREGKPPQYRFFSSALDEQETATRTIRVDAALKDVRPYVAAFMADGATVDEALLKDLIQSQEKLCWNYGRKRETIAMGIYRGDLIKYPVHYRAADPDETAFVPLDFDQELTLREILDKHPKGVDFGWIVSSFARFPYLEDDKGDTLSFPPVINSAYLGAVEVGDSSLFVELTGPDLETLLLATAISACDFADAGFRIHPVKVVYPYDTAHGREIVTPYYFQGELSLEIDEVCRLLGDEITIDEAITYLRKMGTETRSDGKRMVLAPAPYRNDFMHSVDAIEEIAIGRGLTSFQPVLPEEFTAGRCSPRELFAREVKQIMLGLGFQEMIYSYLGSKRDCCARMNNPSNDFIEIQNPLSENYEIVRNSILPYLLLSETTSANALYPHRIFEIGEIVLRDKTENYGAKTKMCLAFLVADRESGFNDVNALVSAIFYYLSMEYTLEETQDPRFIPGRCGTIRLDDRPVGVMGEIHPTVLGNWGIEMPGAAAEIDLELVLAQR